MSDENLTEVTTEGWLSRIGGAFKGIVAGLALFLLAFPLLFWNEGRAVDRIKALEEGAGSVVHIDAKAVDPANELKLVHATAKATTKEILLDPVFNVQANAIKLKRSVQTYQWQQETEEKKEKQLGGSEKTTKTYSYKKVWSESLIDSSEFKDTQYQNPVSTPFASQSEQAKSIDFGGFDFPSRLTSKMSNFNKVDLTSKPVPSIQGIENITHHEGGYFIGEDPLNPQVGDIKVTFAAVSPETVSVVAQQTGNTFQPYITSNGGEILLLEYGVVGQEQMFQSALASNTFTTWLLRFAGLIMMTLGLSLILKPLSVLADVLPVLGNIVEAGTGFIAGLVAVVLTAITIAIAWVFFRPLIGIGLLLVAAAVLWVVKNKVKKNEAATDSEPVAA